MAGPADILREIHRLRKHSRDLREQLDRLPIQRKVQQGKVTRREQELKDGQEALKKLKVSIHEKETTLKSKHQQIAKYERQRDEAGAKKEYDALQHEIATTREQIATLEEEILTALVAVEEKTVALPVLEKAVHQARDELAQFEKGAQDRQANLTAMLTEATSKLKEVEASLPANTRPQYDRVVQALGADALSAVQGRTCLACATEITAQNYNDLRQGLFFQCTACGRILYLSSESE